MIKPTKLYKYVPYNEIWIENLKNNVIYFSDPLNFNDSLDQKQSIKFLDLNLHDIVEILEGEPTGTVPFLRDMLVDRNIQEITLLISKYSKQLKGDELELKSLLDQNLEDKLLQSKIITYFENKYNTSLKETIQAEKANLKNIGVSCFTDSPINRLMWGYYNSFKGMCIEYNTEFEPFTKVHSVDYTDTAPVIHLRDFLSNGEIVKALLATKHIDWKHENEWRVLHMNKGVVFGLSESCVKSITFGSKMKFEQKEIIMILVKQYNPLCRWYNLVLDEENFTLSKSEFHYDTYSEGLAKIESAWQLIQNKQELNENQIISEIQQLTNYEKSHIQRILSVISKNDA